MSMDIIRLTQIVILVGTINIVCGQICYNCNYFQASSTDPGLQTVLGQLGKRQPPYTQCGAFPYYSSGSVPTINCNTLNISEFGSPLGGMPFTGWMCLKQSYTVTLMNYGNGNTVSVPSTVRGCVPIQYGNPYDYTTCYAMSDTTNPYVRAVISSLYFPQNNVGPISMTSGGVGTTNTMTGQICICTGNYCNSTPSLRPNLYFFLVSLALLSLLKQVFTR